MALSATVAGEGRLFDTAPVRVIAATLAFTGPAIYQAIHLLALTNKDIWWHLRTGFWILQNYSIPTNGLFSQAASSAWIDSSWGFDLLTGITYRAFGLAGLPVLLLLLQVAIAIAVFRVARAVSGKFWLALLLSALAQFCLTPLELRPALCSIVLLATELALLVRARRSGNVRSLLFLPLIFLFWVNLDRQFTYGLVALALFCMTVIGQQFLNPPSPEKIPIHARTLAITAGGSLLATLVSPYGYHLDGLVWQSAMSTAADRYFRELHAMRFRQPQDFLILLIAMAAFFALGRRRSRDVFLYALLIFAVVISFRLQRDTWLVVVVAVAVIADSTLSSQGAESTGPGRIGNLEIPALAIVVLTAIGLARVPAQSLMATVSKNFPARACDYIRQNHLPQPLFNHYQWGGFLTWYLPEYPVSIDGRAELYGDEINIGYFKLAQAEIPLQSYAPFAQAKTMLLESNSAFTEALATLPDFRVAYHDDQATVIVRGN